MSTKSERNEPMTERLDGHQEHDKPVASETPKRRGLLIGAAARVRRGLLGWRHRWIHHTVDAPMNRRVADKIPGWVDTNGGRVILGILSLVVVVGWAVALIGVMG